MRRDAFCVDHGFIRCHIEMQVLLMDTSEDTEIRPERRARPLTTIVVDLPAAITIVIPGPFAGTVAYGGVGSMAAMIAPPLVSIEPRAIGRNVVGNQLVAGPRVRVITHPEALFTRLPRDHADDGGTVVGIGPMALALIGTPPWRISGVEMGRAFFPPRFDTTRLTFPLRDHGQDACGLQVKAS
jgi:hypothetical protein